jgi:hypothetical protein
MFPDDSSVTTASGCYCPSQQSCVTSIDNTKLGFFTAVADNLFSVRKPGDFATSVGALCRCEFVCFPV